MLNSRPKWLDAPAPVNYVAGLGRGATGFTTRSDIGPARIAPEPPSIQKPQLPQPTAPKDDDDDDKEDYSESNYDEFEGYGGSLFGAGDPYEEDDKEADAIWSSIDNRMDSRRKSRREERLRNEIIKYRATRPKIQQQFADLKSKLSSVSEEQWMSIPDIGDRSLKTKRVQPERYTPVPDSLLELARAESQTINSFDPKNQLSGGISSVVGTNTPAQDLTQMGEARKKVLNIKLTQMERDSVSGSTSVDPKGYLTDLKSIKVTSDAEIGDIKKARLLLKSVTTTNPKHGPGWIAAARLEEVAGKLRAARKIIAEGCESCPESEDIWLEAARLHPPENAKSILAQAVRHIPYSVKIWIHASSLEKELKNKKRVLRKALEFIPNSVRLWKAAVDLEEPEDARIMLSRAVECVPYSVEMWLALAHLETYENARRVLNKARETIPTDASIWITAAKLEEAHGNEKGIDLIIKRAVKSLAAHGVVTDRETWLKEAENCERAGAVGTCQSIIRETLGIGLDEEERKNTWMEDADNSIAHGCVQTARAIYAHALSIFPKKKSIWLRAAHLEKRIQNTRSTTSSTQTTNDTTIKIEPKKENEMEVDEQQQQQQQQPPPPPPPNMTESESLDSLLKKAVANCPQAEILWLMAAKEKWLAGEVGTARTILHEAYAANPDSEQIWLAAIKLESENNEIERARGLLVRARERAGTSRVWMKSAKLERDLGNIDESIALLDRALELFPTYDKVWMMRAQLSEQKQQVDQAREFYTNGLKKCPNSIPLWICSARFEERFSTPKARALLEKARQTNPKTPELWLEAIRTEIRASNFRIADNLLAKALQDCPNSGILWAHSISSQKRSNQKSRIVDALKKCDNDPHVIIEVAKSFWMDRKINKARAWFNRAIQLNPDLGDAWAYYYKFELEYGTPEDQERVVKLCVQTDPRHGEEWCKVSKAPANYRLKVDQILKQLAESLPAPA